MAQSRGPGSAPGAWARGSPYLDVCRTKPQRLRAQVRLSADVSGGFERTVTLAQPEAVCATVEEWLAEMLRDVDGSAEPPAP
ncbi:MAG: hypothetical protein LC733_03620 [Actinobacteria bacterium]|nr:hypothetical protein [Actinomycetota bacterium]